MINQIFGKNRKSLNNDFGLSQYTIDWYLKKQSCTVSKEAGFPEQMQLKYCHFSYQNESLPEGKPEAFPFKKFLIEIF